MVRRSFIVELAASLLIVTSLSSRGPADAEERAAFVPKAPAFRFERIGPAPHFRPLITNVQIADLDGDGAQDVIACDAQHDAIYCYRRTNEGQWKEQLIGDDLIAPAHATVVELDQDKDLD